MTVLIVAAFDLVLGALIGSIPFGLLVGRIFFRTDIRKSGSGNIGAANALRTYGRGAGVAVLLLDALKGVAAIELMRSLGPWAAALPANLGPVLGTPQSAETAAFLAPLAGVAAVAGHCYSPWLGFRGGKGVATYLGATIALSPLAGLLFAVLWAAVALPTGYASAASLAATVASGAALVLFAHGFVPTFVYALGSMAVVFWRHRENIARLRSGTETKTPLLRRR